MDMEISDLLEDTTNKNALNRFYVTFYQEEEKTITFTQFYLQKEEKIKAKKEKF